MTHTAQASPVPVASLLYAGFWRRFAALGVDGLVLYGVARLVLFVSGHGVGPLDHPWPDVYQVILAVGYEALCLARWGRTLGAWVLRMKVTDERGERPTPRERAQERDAWRGAATFTSPWFPLLLEFLTTAWALVGGLMMLWDRRRQTVWDKLAGTVVVRA